MMNKKYNLAIVINLEEKILFDWYSMTKLLDLEYNISFIKKTQKVPHITLCVGQVSKDEYETIKNKLKVLINNIDSFYIMSNNLGLFLGDSINLHLRWNKTVTLLNLKMKIENTLKDIWQSNVEYNDDLNWLAKTSLAFKDIDYANVSIIDFMKVKIEKRKMLVQSLSIIKFEENIEEEELYRFNLLGGKINE